MPEIRVSRPPTPVHSKSFGPGTTGRGASKRGLRRSQVPDVAGELSAGRPNFSRIDGDLCAEHLRHRAADLVGIDAALETWPGTSLGFHFFYMTPAHDPYSGQPSYWDPVNGHFSALPFVYGTLVSSLLSLVIAVPLAIGLAIFLTEMCPRFLRGPLAFITELLAAIPSIIYGLWAVFVLVPLLREHVNPLLVKYLGWTGLFVDDNPTGLGYVAAAVILAIMILADHFVADARGDDGGSALAA